MLVAARPSLPMYGRMRGPAAALASRRLRARLAFVSSRAELAAGDDGRQAAAARAPAAERGDRRLGAAADPARADARDLRVAIDAPGRAARCVGHAAKSLPCGSLPGTARTSRVATSARSRRGWALNIEHAMSCSAGCSSGGRSVDVRGASPRRSRSGISAHGVCRRRRSSASRSCSRRPPVLRLLRAHSATLGAVAGAGPEPRRHVMNSEQTLVFLFALGWYVWRLLEDDAAAA